MWVLFPGWPTKITNQSFRCDFKLRSHIKEPEEASASFKAIYITNTPVKKSMEYHWNTAGIPVDFQWNTSGKFWWYSTKSLPLVFQWNSTGIPLKYQR
jgi:hypothetical protein